MIRLQVLILDEPTSGLDATGSNQLLKTLLSLSRTGVTILLSIHQPRAEIWNRFDHILILKRGHFVASGSPRDCLDQVLTHGGGVCDPCTNPADLVLDSLQTVNVLPRVGTRAGGHFIPQSPSRAAGRLMNAPHRHARIPKLPRQHSTWNQTAVLAARLVRFGHHRNQVFVIALSVFLVGMLGAAMWLQTDYQL